MFMGQPVRKLLPCACTKGFTLSCHGVVWEGWCRYRCSSYLTSYLKCLNNNNAIQYYEFLQIILVQNKEIVATDSRSCPTLITWGTEENEGILGMNREKSATDASLVASSSTDEFVGNSCKIWEVKQFIMIKLHLISMPITIDNCLVGAGDMPIQQ